MKIEIDGILPAVGSLPITEWEVYVDGEKQIIRSLESRGFREFAIEVEPLVKVIKKNLEEEKKMLNFDKYVNEIIEERKNHTSLDCALLKIRIRHGEGGTCLNTPCGKCREESINWLCDECKPPLLQNGDGLKPGDWIMVRNKECEEWRKRRFMCFRRGMFITSDNSSIDLFSKGTHSDWEQARMPGDGE